MSTFVDNLDELNWELPDPLPANVWRFIYTYARTLDVEKAAIRSGFCKETGAELLRAPRIRTEIQHQLELLEQAIAEMRDKMRARARAQGTDEAVPK